MRINVEFEIDEENVSVVDPDGTVSPMFSTHRMVEDADTDPTNEEEMAHRLRDVVYILMEDGSGEGASS